MSLFSKLFSRDAKVSEESASDSAKAKTEGTPSEARKSSAAPGGSSAKKPSAEVAATEKNAVKTTPKGEAGQGPATPGQPGQAGAAKDAAQAAGKVPALDAAASAKKKALNKTVAYGRAAAPSPAQPPPAAMPPAPAGTPKASAAKPPASPVPPKAAAAPQPSAAVPGVPPLPSAQRDSSSDAIDAALDALEAKAQNRQSSPSDAADDRALVDTFAAVAQLHAQPLRELMFQLDLGHTPREWCLVARPVLRPLLEAAQQIGMLELVGALGAFDAALERAGAESAATLSDRTVETLKGVYQGLCLQLPAVFTVTRDAGGAGRQTVLLESLLLQIPDLHRRTLAKLYAVGLCSLAQLSQARVDELVSVTGLEPELAQRLIAHVKQFEQERTRVAPQDHKSRGHDRLRAIVERLRQLQADFEQAELEEQGDKKRAARRGREAALHELDTVLAEIGEVSVIEELKRCPVQLKIQRVSNYLNETQASV